MTKKVPLGNNIHTSSRGLVRDSIHNRKEVAMFKNKQGINEIVMYGTTHLYCPLGNDFYTAHATIMVSDPKMIPDYCDVSKFFEDIDGKSLIIEDFCKKILKFIKKQTKEALSITVTIDVDDARHLPVSVTISN